MAGAFDKAAKLDCHCVFECALWPVMLQGRKRKQSARQVHDCSAEEQCIAKCLPWRTKAGGLLLIKAHLLPAFQCPSYVLPSAYWHLPSPSSASSTQEPAQGKAFKLVRVFLHFPVSMNKQVVP